ncbi:STAS domain-containing protein [Mucilaginibacter panaciglaebae]|uniref:Anti-sigma factor antagonist n=1 Tax=Mucilaginibacter panaciglaebae TaxID=502331 RepID=A0ABP7WRR4_9SPHI
MISIFKEDQKNLLVTLDLHEASLTNAEVFKLELLQLFETHHKHIILNMDQVEYIDSSFVGALVALLRQLMTVKKDLILVGLRKEIADLFALIRLDKVFKIYSSFDEAGSSLN